MTEKSNTAYFVPAPNESGRGPGVLVLHSWWGLTPSIKKFCEVLADTGCCVMAPNFFGETPLNLDRAKELLNEADPNEMADLVLSSIHALRTYSDDPAQPVAIIGFAMGGSLGLWASTKLGEAVKAVVSVYGTQDIDFSESKSDYLLISAETDEIAIKDEMNYTQALIGLGDKMVESITITGTKHGFFEEIDPAYNSQASQEIAGHIIVFLESHYR